MLRTRDIPELEGGENGFMSPADAAEMLGVARATIHRWVDGGKIPAFKTVGRHRRIRRCDLEKFARRQGMPLVEPGAPRPLLIVDDEKAFLKTLTARIRHLRPDLDVHSAESGFEAGALIERLRPSLVLIDLRMPGLDGIEVARHVTAARRAVKIRIVGMTVSSDKEELRAFRRAGVEDILHKPVDPERLRALLDEAAPHA